MTANSHVSHGLCARECVIWGCVLVAIQVVTFSGFFFRAEILNPADLLDTMLPWRNDMPKDAPPPKNVLMYDPVMAFRPDFLRFQDALREGRWPLWNNMEMCGLPLLANCQSRVFYPPHLLLELTDVDTAMSLFIVIKLWLAPFVAYVCARLLGFGVWPSRWFSLVWGLGCCTRVWAYWPITDVLVWVPLIFLGAEWLVERRFRKGFFALSLGGALCLFAGHPETAFAINLYMTLYFVLRTLFGWKNGMTPLRPIGLYIAAWCLSLAVYAIQLLPFAEYLANTGAVEARTDMPLTATAFASFWVPRFFGTNAEDTFWDKNLYNSNLTIQHYAGFAAWIGIAFAIVYALRKSRALGTGGRQRIAAMLLASFASLAMALDLSSLEWVKVLPGFSHMRTIYHVYFTLFALPVLGLIGLDAWFAQPRRLRDMAPVLLTVLPAVALVTAIYNYDLRIIQMNNITSYVQTEMASSAAFAAITLALIATHCFTARTHLVWFLTIVVSFCDIYYPVRGLNPSLPREKSFRVTPLIANMQGEKYLCRFDSLGAKIPPGTIGNFNIEEWEAYDGLYPERAVHYRESMSTQIWDRMVAIDGVDFYLNDPNIREMFPVKKLVERGELTLETTIDGLDVYRHAGMLPRARLVGKLETVRTVDDLFKRMKGKDFDPARVAITERPPGTDVVIEGSVTPPNTDTASAGTATIDVHTPERVVMSCEAKVDSVLVLAETFYPGWQATVDGSPAELYPVYYCFRGVTVPKGQHVVEMRYNPRSLRIGLVISVAALITSAGVCVSYLFRRRRH